MSELCCFTSCIIASVVEGCGSSKACLAAAPSPESAVLLAGAHVCAGTAAPAMTDDGAGTVGASAEPTTETPPASACPIETFAINGVAAVDALLSSSTTRSPSLSTSWLSMNAAASGAGPGSAVNRISAPLPGAVAFSITLVETTAGSRVGMPVAAGRSAAAVDTTGPDEVARGMTSTSSGSDNVAPSACGVAPSAGGIGDCAGPGGGVVGNTPLASAAFPPV